MVAGLSCRTASRSGAGSGCFCVIDDVSRKCLACVVDTSLSRQRVARELDNIARLRGYPCMVVSDNDEGIARMS